MLFSFEKYCWDDAMARPSEEKVQTTIYLPKSVHTELRIKALREHISMTKLIIRAILRELPATSEQKPRK
jgi:predicted HicB family RNase H-like nuclease